MSTALKKKKIEIKWAPLSVPLHRRLETLAATACAFVGVILPVSSHLVLFWILSSPFWWLGGIYTVYILNDNGTGIRGGRRWESLRNCLFFRYMCRYYPTTLVKTAQLDPNRNYIAPTSPHGQTMIGVSNCFLSNGAGYSSIFPGLTSYLAMAPIRFKIPFLREILIWCGGVSAKEEDITYLMTKGRGNFVSINLGGSSEMMVTKPGKYNVVVKSRRGYARIAIKTGASIVPVFCFGETRAYNTEAYPEGSWLRTAQDAIHSWTGIAVIPARGRGYFQYSFGMLPFREPLNVVVGEPITVMQNHEPTNEEVDALHHKYIEKLVELFETHKHKYEPDPNIKLVLM